MTTVTVTAADGWKEVETASCDIENKSESNVDFIASTVKPGATELGFDLAPNVREKQYLNGSETLWVLNKNTLPVNIVTKRL